MCPKRHDVPRRARRAGVHHLAQAAAGLAIMALALWLGLLLAPVPLGPAPAEAPAPSPPQAEPPRTPADPAKPQAAPPSRAEPPAPAGPPPRQRSAAGLPRSTGARYPWHVLLLGVDERPGIPGRSDAIVLVRVDPVQQAVHLVSIPRDTRAVIPGVGVDKVNAATAYGGPALAKATVETMLGVPVHYYVKVDFAGFRKAIDLMGGIMYDVEMQMHYEDPWQDLVIDLEAGLQRLDGDKALQYVRFRSDERGDDVSRVLRQQRFLLAAADQFLAPANLPRVPGTLDVLRRHMATDIPAGDQLNLARLAFLARNKLTTTLLPGRPDYVQGISFWLPDEAALDQLQKEWSTAYR